MRTSIRRDALLRKRVEQFTRMLHGLEEGDVRALHRTRVASRRLREVLPVLQLDPTVSRKLTRRLRKVTAHLGVVRELDVLLLLIEELQQSGQHDNRALRALASAMVDKRRQARERLMAKVPIGELHRIAAKLGKVADALGAPESSRAWRWALDARVARRAAGLKRTIHDAGAVYLPERLHDVRIALKKLRYALELSVEASGAKTTVDLTTLKRLQAVLGRLHDLQVLIDRVRDVQGALATPDLTVWRDLDALTTYLENSCRRLHARFIHDRAAILTICDRVGAKSTVTPHRSARPA